MLAALASSLLLAQAAAAQVPIETVRLEQCMAQARDEPAAAIAAADTWLADVGGAEKSYPQQCLGYAYTMLLRWDAAEAAFLAARGFAPETGHERRAQLAAMAGNAALAQSRGPAALAALDLAAADAAAAGNNGLRAVIETDRARALVAEDKPAEAEAVLAAARELDPQAPLTWLLSGTLARRLGKLDAAQGFIETAASLSPDYAETALEAGVIAMLQGREEAAAASWRSIIEVEPDSLTADIARGYLAQIADPAGE